MHLLGIGPVGIVLLILLFYLYSSIHVLKEYERGIVFRLGRVLPEPKGPGLIFVFWPIDKMRRVDLRVITLDVPPQDIITKDNVTCQVNAVCYFKVTNPVKAVIEVMDYLMATAQLAQTTLRSVLGEVELDELLTKREELNLKLQDILDKHTDPWGIKVTLVEIKQVDLPQDMQRALARQAEAEREKRAKIIHAEGELEAARKLTEASHMLAQEPVSVQLRYFQTLTELATEKNSTIIFPVPLDLFSYFSKEKKS